MRFKRNPKLVIEVFISAIGLAGILPLFVNQYYTLAICITFVSLIFSFLSIREWMKGPISHEEVKFRYNIKDEDAETTKVRKRKKIKANENNISKIHDRDISADGNIEFIGTNIDSKECEIKDYIDEGGTKSVITSLKTPLKYGKRYIHDIYYRGINAFPKTEESITLLITCECDRAGVRVEYPKEIYPYSKNLYRSRSGRIEEIDEVKEREAEYALEFEIGNPKLGDKYILEWKWEK